MEAFHDGWDREFDRLMMKLDSDPALTGAKVVKQMHEGTNKIYLMMNSRGEKMVLKMYNHHSKVDHSLELSIVRHMAKVGKHPEVISYNDEYRVEELVDSPILTNKVLQEKPVLKQVVKEIAGLHQNKELESRIAPLVPDKKPFVAKVYEAWLGDFEKSYDHIRRIVGSGFYDRLIEELGWLLDKNFQNKLMSLIPTGKDLVLSHNDISPANLLFNQHKGDKNKLYLIDYEYCGWNYRGYDLAVLFEDIGTDYNYPAYPTYKMEATRILSEEDEDEILDYYLTCCGFGGVEKAKALPEVKEEVNSCKIIFQLAGVLWGLTTNDWSASFDEDNCWRLEYSNDRWLKFKELFEPRFGKI